MKITMPNKVSLEPEKTATFCALSVESKNDVCRSVYMAIIDIRASS